jgi:hypothetical protein
MDGPIVEQEKVVLDSQFAVHRYLRLAAKTAAGFPLGLVARRPERDRPAGFSSGKRHLAFDLVTRQPGKWIPLIRK